VALVDKYFYTLPVIKVPGLALGTAANTNDFAIESR